MRSILRPLAVQIIVQRAEDALDQIGYNVIKKNCEHFATYCRYDQECSLQVQRVTMWAMASAVGISLLGVYLSYRNRSNETEDEGTNSNSERPGRRKPKAIKN